MKQKATLWILGFSLLVVIALGITAFMTVCVVKPYVTDDNSNLKEGSEVKVDGTKCKYSVPARSATTVEFILWQEPKVEPPKDSTEAIAFGMRSVPRVNQSTYKVFSALGAFIGEFQAEHIGELRNAMTSAGLGRGMYMVKCGSAKTQSIVLK